LAPSPDPPAATVGDPRKLLDVDMDQLPRAVTLIAAHRFLAVGAVTGIETSRPARFKMACTVEAARPVSWAM